MNWEGQSPIRICEACRKRAKKMLNGSWFFEHPIIKVVLTDIEKSLLKWLDEDTYKPFSPESERVLRGMVTKGVVTMTKTGSGMSFRKVKSK